MIAVIDDTRLAATFLTRLPIAPSQDDSHRLKSGDGFLVRAMPLFPVIGVGIGLVAGLAYAAVLGIGLPVSAAAIISIAVSAILTGALHEDGLADCCDALGITGSPKERLRVMRDSRIGAYGALALILVVGMRVTLIAAIASPTSVISALVVAGAVSRAGSPAMTFWVSPARADGLSVAAGRPGSRCVVAVGILSLAITIIFLPALSAITVVATTIVALLGLIVLSRRMFGGITGDVLGGAQQIVEVAVLMAVVVSL